MRPASVLVLAVRVAAADRAVTLDEGMVADGAARACGAPSKERQ
jgi:hypothetical protein